MNHKNYYAETKKLSEKEQVHLSHTFLQRFKCFAHLVFYCIDRDMQPYTFFHFAVKHLLKNKPFPLAGSRFPLYLQAANYPGA